MGAVEQLLIAFLRKELTSNPALAGKLLQHLLENLKMNPALAGDIATLVDEILPIILGAIK